MSTVAPPVEVPPIETPEVAADRSDADRSARLWIKTLADFLGHYVPEIPQHHGNDSRPDDNGLIPYAVQSARNQAVIAAFERIERICRADVDKAPPLLPSED